MENSERNIIPTVILFEDDKNVKESVVEILSSANYNVVHLDSTVNIRPALEELKPDLIVSDVMMPVKSGLDLIKEIKSIEDYTDLPFIFLTARSDYSDLREGMNLGADDYLVKPFKAKDLLRSVELRIKKAQLLKKKVERFSKSVAISVPHELRTPLISLMGYSDLIIDDYENLSREEIIEYIKRIKFSTGRLHKVIEKFILYSNLLMLDLDEELKNQFLAKYKIDIDELISKEALQIADSYDRKKDLKLNLAPYSFSISEELLSFALNQLIDNAFKFSSEDSEVSITGKADDSRYEIIISDHGIGIEQEQLKELNAFRQFEREKLNQSGSGLGLAIAQKSLLLIGAGILIQSTPESGTKVSIIL